MNILNYDSAQKRRSRLINLRDVISFEKVWDTAQKKRDDSEDWNSRHGMKVLHYILNVFSVHSKSLCWKLEFTWEKEVLDALLSVAVKKANVTVGFISQQISSKYINSIYTNIQIYSNVLIQDPREFWLPIFKKDQQSEHQGDEERIPKRRMRRKTLLISSGRSE